MLHLVLPQRQCGWYPRLEEAKQKYADDEWGAPGSAKFGGCVNFVDSDHVPGTRRDELARVQLLEAKNQRNLQQKGLSKSQCGELRQLPRRNQNREAKVWGPKAMMRHGQFGFVCLRRVFYFSQPFSWCPQLFNSTHSTYSWFIRMIKYDFKIWDVLYKPFQTLKPTKAHSDSLRFLIHTALPRCWDVKLSGQRCSTLRVMLAKLHRYTIYVIR